MNRTLKATAVLMLMMVFAAGCTKPNEPNNVSGNYNGHDYVDLGLPSGTLWATCNVGADTPEGYGDYFAWGETEPKDYYEWSTYKYCNEGNWTGLTKYCSSNSFGYLHFIDDLTVLEAVDDAVTANWGSGWCMPTEDQWEELCQNTSNSWTTQNGINGRLFTASNGNTLFLPAAGNNHAGAGAERDPSLLPGTGCGSLHSGKRHCGAVLVSAGRQRLYRGAAGG